MPPLYVNEQGAVLKKSGNRILVSKNEEILLDLPIINLDRVIIIGNAQLTSQAMALLLDNGIEVSFLSSRGKIRGTLFSPKSRNIFLKLAQYERWRDEEFKLSVAKSIVKAKLNNQRVVLQRFKRNHPEMDFSKQIAIIENAAAQIEAKNSINQLMGLEGVSSGAYFACFSEMVRSEMGFTTRQRRPAPDPVNALLSLGYVLISNELASLLEASSFEPLLGFLHGIRYGRQSLALDLVEEFRQPLIDRFTLMLVNNKIFSEKDFRKMSDGGVYLEDEARKEYFALYEARMREPAGEEKLGWRELFRLQIGKLEKSVMDKVAYEPFVIKF